MKLNEKATALLLGLTLGISGTAFAADGADSFSDVPQGHWAYDALDYLAKDGVIDGMGDGTFQGNRTMTRYEMASIVAKAMQKGNLGVGDQAVLEKLEKEYGSELATLSKQVNANTKAIKDLNAKIRAFVNGWNDRCHPFVWTKTAGQVLRKANRQTTSNTGH